MAQASRRGRFLHVDPVTHMHVCVFPGSPAAMGFSAFRAVHTWLDLFVRRASFRFYIVEEAISRRPRRTQLCGVYRGTSAIDRYRVPGLQGSPLRISAAGAVP